MVALLIGCQGFRARGCLFSLRVVGVCCTFRRGNRSSLSCISGSDLGSSCTNVEPILSGSFVQCIMARRRRSRSTASTWLCPMEGDVLSFRYSRSLDFKHSFYDNFPNGRKVPCWVSFVDMNQPILVIQVRSSIKVSRGHPEASYIAVSFVNPVDDRELWTNYSRNEHIFLCAPTAI